MKKLLVIFSILSCVAASAQQSFTINGLSIASHGSFSRNRERVWETLSNLPIDKSDWRYGDLRKNYLKNWQREIFGTAIFYVGSITDSYTETPSMYFAISPDGFPSRIELDSSKFTPHDDQDHCVEHELGHAAFLGLDYIPGWLLYLGDHTAMKPGSENSFPHERIVRAVVARRDIVDYFNLPINAVITDMQLLQYIEGKAGKLDFGLTWLIETTREDRLLSLLNFENGYMLNEKQPK